MIVQENHYIFIDKSLSAIILEDKSRPFYRLTTSQPCSTKNDDNHHQIILSSKKAWMGIPTTTRDIIRKHVIDPTFFLLYKLSNEQQRSENGEKSTHSCISNGSHKLMGQNSHPTTHPGLTIGMSQKKYHCNIVKHTEEVGSCIPILVGNETYLSKLLEVNLTNIYCSRIVSLW